jgi:hypothetical protein
MEKALWMMTGVCRLGCAQADFAGSGVGFFGADVVEDLLILQRDNIKD